jgi:hypothetical protein
LRPGSLSEGSVPVIFISMVSIHQIDHKTLAIGPIVLELEEEIVQVTFEIRMYIISKYNTFKLLWNCND